MFLRFRFSIGPFAGATFLLSLHAILLTRIAKSPDAAFVGWTWVFACLILGISAYVRRTHFLDRS